MFIALQIKEMFKDRGGNEYYHYHLIDTHFINTFSICQRTGRNWSLSEEKNCLKHVDMIAVYNGMLRNIYNSYKFSTQPSCVNTATAVRKLFHHIPNSIRQTNFYKTHAETVEKGLR